MLKPKRRYSTTPHDQWRKPEYEEHVNKYPIAIASLIGGTAAALVGIMISFVLLVTIWLLAAHGTESSLQVLRASAIAWQATHLVPVFISGIPVGILPWGFAAVPIFIIWKAMHWTLKSALPTHGRQFWLVTIYFSLLYGLVSGLISLICSTDGLSTSFIQAILHNSLIALIVSSVVLLDYAPSPKVLTDRLPADFLIGFKPGLIAFTLIWALSALVTTVSLIARWSEVKAIANLMAPSSLDQIFLTFLNIGYLPTVITWVFSYVFGASIHLGGAAVVSIGVVSPGALPAFPLLAILPSTTISLAKLILLIPVFAGFVIYFLIPREPWKAVYVDFANAMGHLVKAREVIRILYALVVVSAITFLITAYSSGPLGIGYLSFIGPKPIEVVAWLWKTTGLAALLALILPRFILSTLYWWTHRERKAKTQNGESVE